jgi:hypothetical protein
MELKGLQPERHSNYSRGGDELLVDYRQRLELAEQARVEGRRMEVAEQTSAPNGPGTRIRAWEKVHALRMPSSPGHAVLEVIAAATQLTLADVQEEQRVRAGRAAPAV